MSIVHSAEEVEQTLGATSKLGEDWVLQELVVGSHELCISLLLVDGAIQAGAYMQTLTSAHCAWVRLCAAITPASIQPHVA